MIKNNLFCAFIAILLLSACGTNKEVVAVVSHDPPPLIIPAISKPLLQKVEFENCDNLKVCLSKDNFANLISNNLLLINWGNQLQTVLEGLKKK